MLLIFVIVLLISILIILNTPVHLYTSVMDIKNDSLTPDARISLSDVRTVFLAHCVASKFQAND